MSILKNDTEWFSIDELVKITGLSKETIYRRITSGAIENEDCTNSVTDSGVRSKFFKKDFIDSKYFSYYNEKIDFSRLVMNDDDSSNNGQAGDKRIFELVEQRLTEKDSIIEALKKELDIKNQQISNLTEIVRNQQTLSLQQNQHTNLLIDKPKPRRFLSWFGAKNQDEEKTS